MHGRRNKGVRFVVLKNSAPEMNPTVMQYLELIGVFREADRWIQRESRLTLGRPAAESCAAALIFGRSPWFFRIIGFIRCPILFHDHQRQRIMTVFIFKRKSIRKNCRPEQRNCRGLMGWEWQQSFHYGEFVEEDGETVFDVVEEEEKMAAVDFKGEEEGLQKEKTYTYL
ncbi:hypothetical protein DM860_006763 [Cuscuta australis]|uniref:Uncharacterized protein n=1 Tax=Cuscuta australis TaxID=267555 RepID=A0A328D9S8_9ASTE|nr:hypothetical protein DM860_006763 [Cuscuta australis]